LIFNYFLIINQSLTAKQGLVISSCCF